MNTPENSLLNKGTVYPDDYAPELLFPIERQPKRSAIGISASLPFHGYDLWNAFELSWLNQKGKPCVAIGEFIIPCTSPCLIESKSLKLYLNSLNNLRFDTLEHVSQCIESDLSQCAQAPVAIHLRLPSEIQGTTLSTLPGTCLDELDISITDFTPNPSLLSTGSKAVRETLYSDLLKSNCPATGQPDWGSVEITYQGTEIDHAGLLRYIVSLRNHQEFHEQCVERIFVDILRLCAPEELTVSARYTRRGGLDINPLRSTQAEPSLEKRRLARQ